MNRKYDLSLLDKIKEKEYIENINDVEVLIKPIPDSDIKGAMDPRVYRSMKKVSFLSRLIPKRFLKIKSEPKSLERIRKTFNRIDSTPIVKTDIITSHEIAFAEDGYNIPIKTYRQNKDTENNPVLYYIHGGGFFAGHHGVVEEAMKLLVEKTGIVVFSVDYRLAPEYAFPTGHKDAFEGLKWVSKHAHRFGGDSNNIFVGGDSAGGNLAQYCTNQDIQNKTKMLQGQLLLYPTVNMGGMSDDYVDFSLDKFDIYKKHEDVIKMQLNMSDSTTNHLRDLLQVDDVMNQALTPYMDVSKKNPPTFITVGEHDFLTLETLAYARKLTQNKVDTTTILYKGMPHAFIDQVGNYPQSEDCIIEMGHFILKHTKKKSSLSSR